MTREDIDNIISVICPNDEDFEKACISPAYLKKELEALALEQELCEDCISRSEAIRIASGYCHWSRIPEELAKLPAVKPKEITGEWKQGEIDWYKLGECIEEGFRKGLSNDRNKGESKYF